jgi:hypothetical protein
MRYRAEATYRIVSETVTLDDEAMRRRMAMFLRALGPGDRALGEPDIIVAVLFVSADSEDDAERLASERLRGALDAANLSALFWPRRLEVTKLPG